MTLEPPPERVAYDRAIVEASEAASALMQAEAAMQVARERYDLMRHRVRRAREALEATGQSPWPESYDSTPFRSKAEDWRGHRSSLRADEDETTD